MTKKSIAQPKKKANNPLAAFFMGRLYPVLIAASVLVGHLFGLEFYLNIVNLALLSVALLVCDSLRPLVVHLCTFIYQISRQNSPAFFEYETEGVGSDHYSADGHLYIAIAIFAVVFVALIIFFAKNRLITRENLDTLPLKAPSIILALAFLMGGAFSDGWTIGGVGYSLVQIVVWILLLWILVLGFKKDDTRGLLSYFVFVASLMTFILLIETVNIYLTTPDLFNEWGNINKEPFTYGWGICVSAAQCFTVLIPILFIGVGNSKHPIYYFVTATLALAGVVITLSRSALAVAAVAYLFGMIVSFFKSNKKLQCGIVFAVVLAFVGVLFVLFSETIDSVIKDYINRGFDTTGREETWRVAIEQFLEAPVFGKGFFGLDSALGVDTQIDFLPAMAHSTVLQMLAAFGAFGLAAYVIYRVASLRPMVLRPTADKFLLGMAILTVLVCSLVDNFMFNVHPMFPYTVAYAIILKIDDERRLGID